MDEDSENVEVIEEESADSEGWDDAGNENADQELSDLSEMVDANGKKIDGLVQSLDTLGGKADKIGDEVHALKTSQDSKAVSDDIYSDIATLASYQTLLLLVIGAFVALAVGVKIATFFFEYMKDK